MRKTILDGPTVKMERPTKKVLFRESSIEIHAIPSTPDVSDSECEELAEESGPIYATISRFRTDEDGAQVTGILVNQFDKASTLSSAVQVKGIGMIYYRIYCGLLLYLVSSILYSNAQIRKRLKLNNPRI